jgi:hypothetical protein
MGRRSQGSGLHYRCSGLRHMGGFATATLLMGGRPIAVALQIAMLLSGCLEFAAGAAASPLEPELICRAALGSVTDHDPKVFRLTRTDDDVLFLTYVRPIDNFDRTYRCRIKGNRVIWASEPGRWRENPTDANISFEIITDGKQIRIISDRGARPPIKAVFDLDKVR